MITRESKSSVTIKCDCGCNILDVVKFEWDNDPTDYSIICYGSTFYTLSDGIFRTIFERIKLSFMILMGKKFRLYDITMGEETFNEFKKGINKL